MGIEKDKTLESFGCALVHSGKVRDTYSIPGHPNLLLVVASDRISTHNVVHRSLIPGKGIILTDITKFWMIYLQEKGIQTHMVASGVDVFDYLPSLPESLENQFFGRSIIVKRLDMIPIEFIFRKRMAGSLWSGYTKGIPNPYGLDIPPGLQLMSKFSEPLFTPTDKSETDEPLLDKEVRTQHKEAYEIALLAYMLVYKHMKKRAGIEIVDTKLELGRDPDTGEIVVADECFTPDSSRFVCSQNIVIGREPEWMDKQFVREEAEKIWNGGKKSPLEFSKKTIQGTIDRYREIEVLIFIKC